MSKEVIIYKSADGLSELSVHLENEDVWLTQKQLAELYQAAKSTISEHIKNIYTDEELTPEATVRKIRTVQKEGDRAVTRNLDYYNLDMIIALGYRINSKITTRFRQWATARLKEYIIKGFTMADYVRELDTILASAGRKVLDNAGKVSSAQAREKAKAEYKKYKAKTLSEVEKEYLETISN
ncbi:virulence RhuM family protein [Phaeodactylibacter luteus]|uniref:Virulence RhuM family protein n=1 Tax=Phaeodactylibacter luteus TaxID=1564516 RepID=A0A5C6RLW7_9BACT|nr:RhuM family protein [Phaeodactylibacter luteus]TXB62620.1 hypothetical protein FRY97_13455 [Phaeodactylibacter luteus]